MGIPNLIRYEAQVARTGRAKCRICDQLVEKNAFIMKILGFRINQSLHPECVAKLTIGLAEAMRTLKDDKDYVLRAFDGTIKIGYYADTDDPKKKRFTTIQVVRAEPETKVEEQTDERTPS